MQLFPEVIQFTIPFIFILVISAFAALMAYVLYKQTNPDQGSFIRTFLAVLRTVLLFTLIILFFKPRLLLQFLEKKQKNIAMLIDHSASMAWQDENENRADSVKIAVSRIEQLFSTYDVRLQKIFFNQQVLEETDSIEAAFGTTNFKNAFDYLKSSGYDIALLISDGIRTEGLLPQSAQIPVYSIGLGKKRPLPDVFINDVEYTPVVYQDKEQRLIIKISGNNFKGSEARVDLYRSGRLTGSKNFVLADDGTQQDIEFTFSAEQPGMQRFRVEIKTAQEDSNLQNNIFVFTQEVLKNKIRVGIFSTKPDNENKFLKFLLSAYEDFEIFPYIKIRNELREKFPADSLDVIIFQGFPGSTSTRSEMDRVSRTLVKNRQGLILFLDNNTDPAKLSSVGIDDLRLKIRKRTNELPVTITPVASNSLLFRLYDDPQQNLLFFNSVPPVISHMELTDLPGSFNVLLNGLSGGIADNTIMTSESAAQKIIVMNGSGFWRWHFSLQGDERISDGYRRLLANMIRWSANKNKFKPVILNVNRKTVHPGQEVHLDGRLFDSQNNPITKGQITLHARFDDQDFTLPMDADSNGGFGARYTPASEGSYIFTAKGFTNGKEIGSDIKSIEVIPYNREFVRTHQDSSFLKLIAESSGGRYFSLAGIDSLNNRISGDNTRVVVRQEIELRFKSWLLYLIIVVAAGEWAVRKRYSLP